MKIFKLLLIIFLFSISGLAKSQVNKFNISSELFINGVRHNVQDTIFLDDKIIFQLMPTGEDTLENIEINALLINKGELLSQDHYADLSDFNENFDKAIFKKEYDYARLYFCLYNKDDKNHTLNLSFGNHNYQCGKCIMIPIRAK